MSLICLTVGLLSCLIFKNKKEVEKTKDKDEKDGKRKYKLNIREMFDFSIAKNWRFLLWVTADILLEGAFNIPYYFLPCKQE
jgi:hypothetical protein